MNGVCGWQGRDGGQVAAVLQVRSERGEDGGKKENVYISNWRN